MMCRLLSHWRKGELNWDISASSDPGAQGGCRNWVDYFCLPPRLLSGKEWEDYQAGLQMLGHCSASCTQMQVLQLFAFCGHDVTTLVVSSEKPWHITTMLSPSGQQTLAFCHFPASLHILFLSGAATKSETSLLHPQTLQGQGRGCTSYSPLVTAAQALLNPWQRRNIPSSLTLQH